MKPKRMNVQDIAEVLLDELDKMEKTAQTIQRAVEDSKQVLPAIGDQLTRIEQTRVQVDTGPMQAILSRFETLSRQNDRVPTWAAIWLVVASLGALAGIYFAFVYYGEVGEVGGRVESLEQAVEVYQKYLGETGKGEEFQQWVDEKRRK